MDLVSAGPSSLGAECEILTGGGMLVKRYTRHPGGYIPTGKHLYPLPSEALEGTTWFLEESGDTVHVHPVDFPLWQVVRA